MCNIRDRETETKKKVTDMDFIIKQGEIRCCKYSESAGGIINEHKKLEMDGH